MTRETGRAVGVAVVWAFAASVALSAHGRTVSANYTLTQDEDWTSDGTIMFADSPTIDLNGHNLTVAGLSAYCITNAAGVVAGYSDLAFLDTSGSQRILTDFKPQDSDVVYMGVKFHSGSAATQMLWCDRVNTKNTARTFTGLRYSKKFRFDRNSSSSMTGTQHAANDNVYYDIVANYSTGVCTVNGETAGTMSDTDSYEPPTNLVLFASFSINNGKMESWNYYADLQFYYLIVRRAGDVVAHFVPVIRQSDGMIGVYDRVKGKFYKNENSSLFTVGSTKITNSATGDPAELRLNVAPTYQELEYIQPKGSEFIQTDYTPAWNDRVEMKFNFTTVGQNQFLFCSRTTSGTYFGTVLVLNGTDTVTYRYFRFDHGSKQGSFKTYEALTNTDYVIVADGANRSLSVNGETLGTVSSSSFTPQVPFQLFATSYNSGGNTNNFAKGKCYYFKVYDNANTLKVDMVPARSCDNRYGMYDRVGGKFYPSASKTAFTAHGTGIGAEAYFVNDTVSFTGNMKVVKKGVGTYVAAQGGQTYTGGTEVLGGLLRCGQQGSYKPLGADSSTVVITTNGTFDINGKLNLNNYAFVLAGGLITNSVDQGTVYNNSCMADVTLTADSSLVTGGRYAFAQKTNDVWHSRLDLAGHTLTIKAPTAFYFRGVEAVSPGTIELHGPRLLEFIGNDSDLLKVNMVVTDGGLLRVNNGRVIKLGDYVSNAETEEDSPSYNVGKLEVYGTFTPNTDYFRGLELQNGATIDLSGRTTPMPCQSLIGTNCVDAAKNVTFATNATINVTWNGRVLSPRQPLISWTTETKPVNLDTLRFVGDAGTSSVTLQKMEDGVYLPNGVTIIFR